MADQVDPTAAESGAMPYPLPRVTIKFCTQCKWMLRAAYYAQELLSTFSTALGEVALQPSTGGTFTVDITFTPPSPPTSTTTTSSSSPQQPQSRTIWDRKTDGGFPETKELKRRVRDAIEPGRDLGHVDRDHHKKETKQEGTSHAPAEDGSKGQSALPTKAELHAAGPAGAGGPGEDEAAARLVDDVLKAEGNTTKDTTGLERQACEDCA